jgi:integrase
MNIELIGRTWFATLLVPKDAREAVGRTRFRETLGTSNRREAERLAAPLLGHWRALIKQAQGSTNAVTNEALRWKQALSQAPDEDTRETWGHALTDKLEGIEEAHGFPAAKEFSDLAAGLTTPSNHYFDTWKGQLRLAPKTKDQMVKDVGLLVAEFPALQGITKAAVRRWVDKLMAAGAGDSSIRRILSFCRNYWKYLQRYEAVDKETAPFTGVFESAPKGTRKGSNLPYSSADVVKLWQAATVRLVGQATSKATDTQLADLIALGAFTGARIEELCSLKTSKVFGDSFSIEDAKTAAGWREVPIHSAIAPLVKRLKKASKDGYLISGLTFNKYEDRSNAIGKRYGRLKKAQGFPDTHTFHSFRSTVSTLLENAKVPEGIAADIIGHDKPSMTYGLYSGGADMATKREALEKVAYPFPAALK